MRWVIVAALTTAAISAVAVGQQNQPIARESELKLSSPGPYATGDALRALVWGGNGHLISGDGTAAYFLGPAKLTAYDLRTGKQSYSRDLAHPATAIRLSSDAKHIVANLKDGGGADLYAAASGEAIEPTHEALKRIDFTTYLKRSKEPNAPKVEAATVAVFEDKYRAVLSNGADIILYDGDGKQLAVARGAHHLPADFKAEDWPHSILSFSPDGKYLVSLAASFGNPKLWAVEPDALKEVRTLSLPHGSNVGIAPARARWLDSNRILFDDLGQSVYDIKADEFKVVVCDKSRATGKGRTKVVRVFTPPKAGDSWRSVAISQDANTVVAVTATQPTGDATLLRLDARSGEQVELGKLQSATKVHGFMRVAGRDTVLVSGGELVLIGLDRGDVVWRTETKVDRAEVFANGRIVSARVVEEPPPAKKSPPPRRKDLTLTSWVVSMP